MKSLFKNLLLLTSVFSLAFLFSCGDEDPEGPGAAPSVTVTTTVNGTATTDSPIELVPGDSLGFSVDITAEEGFNTLNVTYSVDGAADVNFETISRVDVGVDVGTSLVEDILLSTIIENDLVGSNVIFTFEAVDETEPGQTSTATVEVNVSSPEANSYTDKLLYAQLGDDESKTFFSTNLGVTVTKNEVEAVADPSSIDIDFGYAVGVSGTAWLASPSNYPTFTGYDLVASGWNDLNTTNFKKVTLTSEEYIAITTNADLQATYEGSDETPADRIEGVEAGDYYAIQLDEAKGSKYALISVIAKVDGDDDGEFTGSLDYLEIEVIVESDSE